MSLPRVLIIPDVQGWAWDNRACGIQRYATKASVSVMYQADVKQSDVDEFDAVLVMSWPDAPNWKHPRKWTFVANEGTIHPHNPNAKRKSRRTASRSKNIKTAMRALPTYRGVLNINPRIANELREINENTHYLRTGVDTEFWQPTTQVGIEMPWTIGWSGKAFSDPAMWTPKGYAEIVKPLQSVLDRLKRKQFFLEINSRSWQDRLTPEQQRSFYNLCDVFLVTSCSEGTPSCLLEAMACGRSFISTPVGIAPDLWHDEDGNMTGTLLPGWDTDEEARLTLDAIVDCLGWLHYEPDDTLRERGLIARQYVEREWSWATLADEWVDVLLNG